MPGRSLRGGRSARATRNRCLGNPDVDIGDFTSPQAIEDGLHGSNFDSDLFFRCPETNLRAIVQLERKFAVLEGYSTHPPAKSIGASTQHFERRLRCFPYACLWNTTDPVDFRQIDRSLSARRQHAACRIDQDV